MVSDSASLPRFRDTDPTRRNRDRVRKRAPNACDRCRQQKIKCSGSQPCAHCQKRNSPCVFDDKHQKVLVTRGWLSDLEKQAAQAAQAAQATERADPTVLQELPVAARTDATRVEQGPDARIDAPTPTGPSHLGIDQQSDAELGDLNDSGAASVQDDQQFTNPLLQGNSAYWTTGATGQNLWLGTSSNWSFGRRIMTLAHGKVFGTTLPNANLRFDGVAYDLGWDGRRTAVNFEQTALPTADFALFLINAVKFHCGQLYHVFDEQLFMHYFGKFHEGANGRNECPDLWHVHYLLVLALGKALMGRTGTEGRPPGADLFVQGMKLLPDSTFLWTDPLQSTEVLCCAALYLQCLDMRIAAYNIIGQATRTAVSYGWHTDMPSNQHSEALLERCREVWWTVYALDSHISALMGCPTTLHEQDITARLPAFGGSIPKSLALDMHVKLSKITASIQQTVYSKQGRAGSQFLKSMKTALKTLADINDERTAGFPLPLDNPSSSISRLSAHLHLFHHQCIILTTRPLLYCYFQRRLEKSAPVRISSAGGVRALLRVCVGSARQIMKILTALQSQSLLESFITFDLDSAFSGALVLLVASIVDPTMFKDEKSSLQTAYGVLDEMASRGNQIAAFRKAELEQLDMTLRRLESMPEPGLEPDSTLSRADMDPAAWDAMTQTGSTQSQSDFMPLQGWNFEDPISGQQLEAVADSLNLTGLDWLCTGDPYGQLDASLL